MRIVLAACPLKHLMQLFETEAPIYVRELGDTWYPSSGYVDERLVQGIETVAQLRAYEYDFRGLVYFDAVLPELTIRYHDEQYTLNGPTKVIWRLLRRLEELNARPGFLPKLQVLARHED